MAPLPKTSPGAIGAVTLLGVLAFLGWMIQLPGLVSLSGSDAAGNAMSQGFAALAAIVLWFLLAVIMVIAAWKAPFPAAAEFAALILVPASGYAALTALDLLARPYLPPNHWPVIIPALVPPLILAFGFWALIPPLRAKISAALACAIVWGAVLILTIAIVPMSHVRDLVNAKEAARWAKFSADYAALPPDAPLWDLAPFLDAPDQTMVSAVIDRMKKRDQRQSETEIMLDRGDFPLGVLERIDLDPTPAICDKARNMLRQRAASLMSKSPGTESYKKIFIEVNDALAAMRWLVGYECSCNAESLAWEAAANSYPDPGFDLVELRELRVPKELGRILREYPERFSMLSPKSHLKAWLRYADDKALREQALAGARNLDHRNVDAIEMLKNKSDISAPWMVLKYFPDLDLEASAPLCEAALAQVRGDLTKVYRPTADDPRPYRELLDRLGAYAPLTALLWLAGHGCNAEAELTEAESVIATYQDSPGRSAMLAALAKLHRKP